ncbi:hypothetical protein IMSAGC002_00026 [Lachnospiraceae bacterium]|nr:hypothetical protein IMSAGC002_00026 [Lachnospiraceae bacterium]
MTRKEAMEYNDSLKKELEQTALKCGLEKTAGTYIVDNYITVLPEDARKGMIFLGEDSASYKMGNIKIDLKKAVIAGLEFAASISKPESVFNYIQLIIVSVFFIENSTKHELSRLEAYVIYLLHEKGAYNTGVEEERFIREAQEWYQQKEGKAVAREEVVDAINNMYEIKAADVDSGNICLKEHVWGTVE